MKAFREINQLNPDHIKQLLALYQNEWWTKGRTLSETTEIVNNSTVTIGMVNEDDRLIAFVRILSDKVIKALIFDVIVKPEYRGIGLGEKLIETVKKHPTLKNVKHFELYCLPEMAPFYADKSFKNLNNEQYYMRYINPLEG